MHVTDRHSFQPVRAAICILSVLLKEYPNSFRWKEPPYEFVEDRLPIDILFGNSWIREELEKGALPDDLEQRWSDALRDFLRHRATYLLYE